MSENQIGLLAKLSGAAIALVSAAFGLGKYNACVVKKNELYYSDGSLIYLTVKQANEQSEKIDEKLDKIVDHLKEQNKESKQISEFMGMVKQYIKNNSK